MKYTGKKICQSRWMSAATLALTAASMLSTMAAQVNVYNITDSINSVQVRTFSDDIEDACRIAGYEEDYRIIADSGQDTNVRTLTVAKQFPVNVLADNNELQLTAVRGTVEEILIGCGVYLGEYDETIPSRNAYLTEQDAGKQIAITRVRKETITEAVEIPHETIKRTREDLDYGTINVLQEGRNGQMERTTVITYREGQEAGREVTKETVLEEAQTEILEAGTGRSVVTRGGEKLRYVQELDVKATAYSTEGWSRENKYTKIGTLCRVGAIAVDPKVIPLGSRLYITSADGTSWIYGTAVAEDTGGAIKGNRIDLYFNTQAECERFGVRSAKVYVLA